MALLYRKKQVVLNTLTSTTRTASAAGDTSLGYAGVEAVVFQLAVTAASGTTPNMVMTIEDSLDDLNWNTIATFTAATGVTNQVIRVNGPFCDMVRSRTVLTGTTPSFTFSVVAQAEGGRPQ